MREIARITERPSQDSLDAMSDCIESLPEDSDLREFLMDIWRDLYRGRPVVLYALTRDEQRQDEVTGSERKPPEAKSA
jgi:hypothetical protein